MPAIVPRARWSVEPFDAASAAIRGAWQEVANAASVGAILAPDFVFTCARTLGGGPLLFASCRREGRLVAVALLRRTGALLTEVFIEAQMPLGAWVQLPGEDFERLARGLLASCGLALRLGVSQLDPRFASRPVDGPHVRSLDYIRTAWVEFDGTFDAYWAARGKNLRTNLRKQRDKLAAQGVRTRMEVLTDASDMRRAVDDYAALESRGWKAGVGTALSDAHPQTVFYREMMGAFAQRGLARVYRYFFDGRLVATELCVLDRDEMVILKTTHDESTHPFSPASLLRQEMFAVIFAEGRVRRLEFYGPLMDWHTRWTDRERVLYHANVYRFPWVRDAERGARGALHAARSARAVARGLPVDFRSMGSLGLAYHLFERSVSGLSCGRCKVFGVRFYAQPVPTGDRVPAAEDGRTTFGVVAPGEVPEEAFGRPAGVIEDRFREGNVCVTARRDRELAGFLWLSFGPLHERLVRCVFEPLPAAGTAWDYDLFVAPGHRMGRTFARLWDAANRVLRERGVRWTGSWIGLANRTSALAHERMGARRVGWAIFLTLGRAQVTVASVAPYAHLSLARDRPCRLRVPVGDR